MSADQTRAAEFTRSPCFVNRERARQVMADQRLDALVGATDANLYYLSGHAPDSVLAHFWDQWAAAVLPAHEGAPPCLITSEYDLAYCATHETWMPELRVYGAEWSSAATLLDQINRGHGVDTELRPRLRELYRATWDGRTPSLVSSIARYIDDELPSGTVRVGFDDVRLGWAVQAEVGDRLEVVDGHPPLRRIRLVKTPPEIELLRRAAAINDQALHASADAIVEGRSWYDMIRAYREALNRFDAKPMGERGMLFAAGPDGSFVLDHDYVARKTFAPGQAVVMDVICTYRMYHADMARTAMVGEPSKRHRELHAAVKDALEEAEKELRPGVHTSGPQAVAADTFRKHGLDPGTSTLVFHPIGLNIFDYGAPEDGIEGWTLEANTVINFEVFYRDAEHGGIHLEDTVMVTDNGLEFFSEVPREMIVR